RIPDCIIFSSRHAIDSFFKQIQDIRQFSNTKFLCVGPSSAKHLKSYGISCDFMPSIYNLETLIQECPFALKNGAYLSGSNKSECEMETIKVYENKEEKIQNMKIYHPVLFTCGSNVNRFLSHVINLDEFKEKGIAYSIGPKTTKVLKEWGIQHIKEAKESTLVSLCELVKENEN
ncbi:MAG: uroporphyrinogen-III synthase, partial [Floccifex sp.]